MQPNITSLERAFELAGSGTYRQAEEIRARLRPEGYFTEAITGPALHDQLKSLMEAAQRNRWKRRYRLQHCV
jgi:hypothetical protein